mmetsp:Transcript_2883/g.7059  ORF Transcript_2883/g.7059 Transcript_2883/m.7059 type:complete len:500 (+) Transcript_2883:901-2400(+)
MARQEGEELLVAANGPDTRPTAAVRDAEGLVQVEVAHVRAHLTRRRQTHLGVHVGTVHVHKAAVLVDDVNHLPNAKLEHSVGGGVCDHEGGEVVLVLLRSGPQRRDVNVAQRVARHHDNLQPKHGRTGRVGAVGRHWDDTHVAVTLVVVLVVPLDGLETGVFTRGSTVGLQRTPDEAGDVAQPVVKQLHKLRVPSCLVNRDEGVHLIELRPSDGNHLRGCVEFHRAGTKRDHGMLKAQVLAREVEDVTKHLRLGVVLVEHRLLHERRRAAERADIARRDFRLERLGRELWVRARVESAEQSSEVVAADGLVEGDGDGRRREAAHIDVLRDGCLHHSLSSAVVGEVDADGVEEGHVGDGVPELPQASRKNLCGSVHAQGNVSQPLRSVVDGIHGCRVRQQGLGGANVRGCLLALDVLLTRLQSKTQSAVAETVACHADDAARQKTAEGGDHCKKSSMRPTISERHAKPLRVAEHNVSAHLAGSLEHREREEICRHDDLAV